jgi:hypothetical protein
LKENLLDFWAQKGLAPNEFPERFPASFDLLEPDLDFVGLAAAMRVPLSVPQDILDAPTMSRWRRP